MISKLSPAAAIPSQKAPVGFATLRMMVKNCMNPMADAATIVIPVRTTEKYSTVIGSRERAVEV